MFLSLRSLNAREQPPNIFLVVLRQKYFLHSSSFLCRLQFFFYQSNSHEFPLETVLWVIQELLAECFGNLDRLLDVPCCLISSIWILDWNQNLGISLQVLHGGQGWPRDLCDFDGQ